MLSNHPHSLSLLESWSTVIPIASYISRILYYVAVLNISVKYVRNVIVGILTILVLLNIICILLVFKRKKMILFFEAHIENRFQLFYLSKKSTQIYLLLLITLIINFGHIGGFIYLIYTNYINDKNDNILMLIFNISILLILPCYKYYSVNMDQFIKQNDKWYEKTQNGLIEVSTEQELTIYRLFYP